MRFLLPKRLGKRKVKTRLKNAVITQALLNRIDILDTKVFDIYNFYKEFDPGSGRTLAARLTHASRTELRSLLFNLVADG